MKYSLEQAERIVESFFEKKQENNLLIEMVENTLDEMANPVQGFDYEEKVIATLNTVGMSGEITSGAGASAAAADADMRINGELHKIEVKLDPNAQMGGTSLRYNPDAVDPSETFTLVNKSVDPDTVFMVEEALTPIIPKLNEFLAAINAPKLPAVIEKDKWKAAVDAGLLRPLMVKIKRDASFIINHYKKKGVNYIQIGKAGLFYLTENPAGLPVPQLAGDINIELRPGRSGSRKRADGVKVVSGVLRVQGRLQFKGQSPYTLDDPESVQQMLADMPT